MKRKVVIILAFLASVLCQGSNRNYMWFDCEANYRRLSTPDSIRVCLEKVRNLGFDNVVVDLKSIMGEVLYDSDIAPYMSPFDKVSRPKDYDMMGFFIDYGHKLGMKVYASLNVFCGGHNFMRRGIIYGDRSGWQSICYHKGKLVPVSKVKGNYNGMLNPSDPEVRQYQLAILKEFATKYPACDGVIFDRVRYDGVTADFSELSRRQFEQHIGHKVENFPEDILSWYDGRRLRRDWIPGKLMKQWAEWRAGIIHDFIAEARNTLKSVNPSLEVGDYTGAWYPTYWQVGANWAADTYDPSKDYDWASSSYSRTGYAQLLDLYFTGLYYSYITKADVDRATGVKGQSSEAGLQLDLSYCYSVEGGAEIAKAVTRGVVPVTGSIYVEQYIGGMDKFAPAVHQSLESTGGVMIFDISHLYKHHLWEELETVMREKGQIR